VGRVLLGLWLQGWGGVGMVELLPLVFALPWVALVLVGLLRLTYR
jgi:hypothetical protein